MVRIGPHTTVASRAEQAASEAMQKLNLSTNFAVNAHDVVLHSLRQWPALARLRHDLHCSSLARLRNNSANGKATSFTVRSRSPGATSSLLHRTSVIYSALNGHDFNRFRFYYSVTSARLYPDANSGKLFVPGMLGCKNYCIPSAQTIAAVEVLKRMRSRMRSRILEYLEGMRSRMRRRLEAKPPVALEAMLESTIKANLRKLLLHREDSRAGQKQIRAP